MNTPENLGVQVADKTNDQLSAMLKQPDDWRPEALDAARAELQRRGVAASTIAFANSSTPHPDDTPKSSSSLEWYYVVGDERRGPVSEPTLIAIVKSGALNKSTKIWKEGFPKWILLENTPFPEFLPRQGPPPLDQVETANHEEENDRPQPSISETKGLKEPLYNDATDATGTTKFCRNCGKQVSEMAIACPVCGVPPGTQKNFCHHCGKPTSAVQIVCTQCGVSLESPNEKGKVPAGMLGIFLGGFGAHKFYLGYTGPAVFTLITSIVGGILTMGVIYGLMAIVGFIEGIIYLTKSDQEFARIYVKNRKTWF